MYLSIPFVEELLVTLDKVVPEKVMAKEKKLAAVVSTLRTCVETHKKNIKDGKGIVIGRDVQEVRYLAAPLVAATPPTRKKLVARKKKTC